MEPYSLCNQWWHEWHISLCYSILLESLRSLANMFMRSFTVKITPGSPLERLGQRWAICCVKAFPIWYLFSDSSGVISRGLCLHSTHDLPRLPHRHCKNCVSSASRHPWPLQAALGCTCPCCCYPCNMFVVVAGIVIFTFCSTAIDIAMFVTLKQKQYTYKYKYTIYIYTSVYIYTSFLYIYNV